MILYFILVYLVVLLPAHWGLEPYDLPIVPESVQQHVQNLNFKIDPSSPTHDKHIPRNAWIAVRNVSEAKPNHMLGPKGFIQRNSNWKINFCDNLEKDSFMEQNYANSSILWAYNILNPVIGTSKVEIWRLAVLYLRGGNQNIPPTTVHYLPLLSLPPRTTLTSLHFTSPYLHFTTLYPGMYMDDDANFDSTLDEVVQPADRFIVGKEPYDFDDRCYTNDFPLSNYSMGLRFSGGNSESDVDGSSGRSGRSGLYSAGPNAVYELPPQSTTATTSGGTSNTGRNHNVIITIPELFDNKFFFNWALFSAPGNPLLLRIMQHIVVLLKHEYLGDSKIKLSPIAHRGKLLMCATTFPITHAAREMVLEGGKQQLEMMGLRVGGVYFKGEETLHTCYCYNGDFLLLVSVLYLWLCVF